MTLHRYLAIIALSEAYDRDHVERVAALALEVLPHGTSCVADRLVLIASGAAITASSAGASLIAIGRVFAEPGGAALSAFSPGAGHAVCSTDGAWLIDKYWGPYVAFISDPLKRSVHVVRDPSAGIPCYYLCRDNVCFVASDIDLLERCGLLRKEIEWTYVARHLLANQLRVAGTCLVGLSELLPGYRLSSRPEGVSLDQLWSPWAFAARDVQIREQAEAVERLRNTAIACVRSLVNGFDHVLLNISGGLDSSIVAACLAQSGTPFTSLTLATDEYAGDERSYARLVADATGSPLVEMFERTDKVDLSHCAGSHLPRPIARAFAQSADWANCEVADQVDAQAFFGGAGGDNIFCFLQSGAPVADRLLMEGPSAAWRTAGDIAELAETDIVTVFATGVRRAWLRKPGFRWRLDPSFLSANAIAIAEGVRDHPWLEAPPRALPGKAGHIASVMNIQNHLEGFRRELARPVIAPLLAQPLVELCLRIPSWMWCEGGRDRAVARHAFADLLPATIVERRLKGTPDGFIVRLFEENRDLILDMLLGGLLAEQALLDCGAIERVIKKPSPPIGLEFFRIMALLDVEIWAGSMKYDGSAEAGSGCPLQWFVRDSPSCFT